MQQIVIVEDDRGLSVGLGKALRGEGRTVCECYSLREARQQLALGDPALVLLDVGLPDGSGLELLREIRARTASLPVILLTANDTDAEVVEGLESGGDYYLVKPFNFPELLAVVRAISRKYTGNRSNIFTAADLTVDVSAKTVTRAGKNIELTSREFALLEYMLRNKGIVLTREMIENNLWNYDYEGGTNVVDVYIRYLRKKIDDGFDKKLIHTVRGMGYVIREEK